MDLVDNRLDPNSGTIRGRAVFDDADGFPQPGIFGRGRLIASQEYEAPMTPGEAIVADRARSIVYVVGEDDTVESRVVERGALRRRLRIVPSGLEPGDRMVVSGLQRVRPGAAVSPREGALELAASGGRPMAGFARFFASRPVFAIVLSTLILLIGTVSDLRLPVAACPEVAPPTIQVTAAHPGASAETVPTPPEQEIDGAEGMLHMLGQSTGDGRVAQTITFGLGTDVAQAQVLVHNRVAIAEPRLLEPVGRVGFQPQQNSPSLLMVVHMPSPGDSRDQRCICDCASTPILDRLLGIDGVGRATVFGERACSMRICLDPDQIAACNLTAGEVVAALRTNNVQAASGSINALPIEDQAAFQLDVETQGRLVDPQQLEGIAITAGPEDRKVRVRDIGRVELGAQDCSTNGCLSGTTALPIGIFRPPGSNALATAEEVRALMEEISGEFPPGLEHTIV